MFLADMVYSVWWSDGAIFKNFMSVSSYMGEESVTLIAWMTRHAHDSNLFVFSSEMYPATLLGLVNSNVIDGSDPCSMQFVYNENIFVAISRAFESLISLHFGRGVNKFDIFILIRVSTASA